MRSGRRIAIDYGAARIGVAVSSPDGLVCSPLATVSAGDFAMTELVHLVNQEEPIEIYVGLPLNLRGENTKSTQDAIKLGLELAGLVSCEVRMVDERMTSRVAQGQLHASGKNSKTSRNLIDAAAASLILEGSLAFEKSTGNLPGKSISEFDA